MAKLKLVIVGANGRMGSRIVTLAEGSKDFQVVCKYESNVAVAIESELVRSSKDVPMYEDFEKNPEGIARGDVIIDFSNPLASLGVAKLAAKYKKPIIIGTTGFTPFQEERLKEILRSVPVVKSANMSQGVNAFFSVAQRIAKTLPEYKVHIQETHHVHKKDAPSGTALQVGKLIEKASGQKATYESFREGDVVGDHRVVFKGPTDTIELFHHAGSRDIFATGAIQAAKWVAKKKPGFYSMQDVLGL